MNSKAIVPVVIIGCCLWYFLASKTSTVVEKKSLVTTETSSPEHDELVKKLAETESKLAETTKAKEAPVAKVSPKSSVAKEVTDEALKQIERGKDITVIVKSGENVGQNLADEAKILREQSRPRERDEATSRLDQINLSDAKRARIEAEEYIESLQRQIRDWQNSLASYKKYHGSTGDSIYTRSMIDEKEAILKKLKKQLAEAIAEFPEKERSVKNLSGGLEK